MMAFRRTLLVAALALAACTAPTAPDADTAESRIKTGALDSTFGVAGKLEVPLAEAYDKWARRVLVQPDRKVVVLGNGKHMQVLARFEENGAPDVSFGANGQIVMEGVDATDVVVLPSGSIVLLLGGGGPARLRKLGKDGALDLAFGNGAGERAIVLAPCAKASCTAADQYMIALAPTPDGALLVLGSTYDPVNRNAILARYDANGTPDTGFGAGGTVLVPQGWAPAGQRGSLSATPFVVQRDGKIVIIDGSQAASEHWVERRNADGSLDTTFGLGGRVTVAAVNPTADQGPVHGLLTSAVEQSDGSIVLAGTVEDGTLTPNWRAADAKAIQVVRLTPKGQLDASFANNGGALLRASYSWMTERFSTLDSAVTPDGTSQRFPGFATDRTGVRVLADATGRLLVAADVAPHRFDKPSENDADRRNLVVFRLASGGTIDASFGVDGLTQASFGGADYLGDAVVRPGGKLLVGLAATKSTGVSENSVYGHVYDQRLVLGQFDVR